jgi:hypothetical protein
MSGCLKKDDPVVTVVHALTQKFKRVRNLRNLATRRFPGAGGRVTVNNKQKDKEVDAIFRILQPVVEDCLLGGQVCDGDIWGERLLSIV